MYYVLYSDDPYLLARMATDLQMEGFQSEDEWNVSFHPFVKNFKWMPIYTVHNIFNFIDHKGSEPDCRLWLTSRNYLRVLGEILNNKNK